MKKTSVIRCLSCGSSDVQKIENGLGKCSHCGSTIILPRQDEEIISLLNTAYLYRVSYNYDLAIKTYKFVLEKDNTEKSAYEGLLLAEYGIEYVKDTYTGRMIPTCHRTHFTNIFDNANYKALLELSNDEQKNVVEAKAKEIDSLQKEIKKQLQHEEDYDIFISYKATDDKGEKTEDSVIARQIYDELTQKNYKVFLAEKSLEDRLGVNYEPIIFKALHTSKIFILVGTSKQYIESSWVRNEWSRFIDRIKTDRDLPTNCFIPVFKDMSPYDMPKVNDVFVQGVDASKIGYLVTVVDGVTKLLKPEKEQKIIAAFDDVDNYAEFERIRKQRHKELLNKNRKDMNTNPNRKKNKIVYYTFTLFPYLMFLLSMIFTFIEGSYFHTSPLMIVYIVFNSLALIGFIVQIIAFTKKYGAKLWYNILCPILCFVLPVASYFAVGNLYPALEDGRTLCDSGHIVYATYSDGMAWQKSGNWASDFPEEYHIYFFTKYGANKHTKVIDGKRVLFLPEKAYDGNIIRSGYIYMECFSNIDVVVLPKYAEKFQIFHYSASFSVDEIYSYSTTQIYVDRGYSAIYHNAYDTPYYN